MLDAYEYDKKRENVVLHLSPKLAPYTAAVFPIVKGDKYEKLSKDIVMDLRKKFNVLYDTGGSIGRRYSRNDEMGTPFAITIDESSSKDKAATIRDRDSTKQIRVKISELRHVIGQLYHQDIKFEKAGRIVNTRVK